MLYAILIVYVDVLGRSCVENVICVGVLVDVEKK